jgi:hypothetical protein
MFLQLHHLELVARLLTKVRFWQQSLNHFVNILLNLGVEVYEKCCFE